MFVDSCLRRDAGDKTTSEFNQILPQNPYMIILNSKERRMNTDSPDKLLQLMMLTAAKIERPAVKCQAYVQLAAGFLAAGQPAAAMEFLAAAEKAAGSLKRPEEKAAILARMGLVYF